MEWKDEYYLGIKEIDSQHKELMCLFQHITDAVDQNLDWSEIHLRIIELKNFATLHFEVEECLMRLFGYVEIKEHAESHAHFFTKLSHIEQSAIMDQVKTETVNLLYDWMFNHILSADRAYVTYILNGAKVIRT